MMVNNPSGLTKHDTLEDAFKRADYLAEPDGSSHSGMMCFNKDLRRIVLLVRELRKANNIIAQQSIEQAKEVNQ